MNAHKWLFAAWLTANMICASAVAVAAPAPCRGSDLTAAQDAQTDAKGSISTVVNFLNGADPEMNALLARWFGKNDTTTRGNVRGIFSRVLIWMNGIHFWCEYQNDGNFVDIVNTPSGAVLFDYSGQLFAYVLPADTSRIYLGLAFLSAPPTGFNSKLGTITHEMTHFIMTGNTRDVKYGKDKSLALAQTNPELALKNADNYEYFVEEFLKK